MVHRLNSLVGSNDMPNKEDIDLSNDNILVFDYTPVTKGNILLIRPGGKWTKLSLNSKIINAVKREVPLKTPHSSNRQNRISSIRRSSITLY